MPLCIKNPETGAVTTETKDTVDIESIHYYNTAEDSPQRIWRIRTKGHIRHDNGSRLDLFVISEPDHLKALELYFKTSETPLRTEDADAFTNRHAAALKATADFIVHSGTHLLRVKGELDFVSFLPPSIVNLESESFK